MADKTASQNQTLILIGVLLAIVGLGGSYMLVIPQLKTARTNLGQVQATGQGLDADTATLETAQKELQTAETNLQSKGVNFDSVAQIYPATEDIPDLYIEMEFLLSQATGLTQPHYQIANPVSDTSGIEIPITLTASGTYPDIMHFVSSLGTYVRPLSVTALSFVQAGSTNKVGEPIVNVNITAYARSAGVSASYTTLLTPGTN